MTFFNNLIFSKISSQVFYMLSNDIFEENHFDIHVSVAHGSILLPSIFFYSLKIFSTIVFVLMTLLFAQNVIRYLAFRNSSCWHLHFYPSMSLSVRNMFLKQWSVLWNRTKKHYRMTVIFYISIVWDNQWRKLYESWVILFLKIGFQDGVSNSGYWHGRKWFPLTVLCYYFYQKTVMIHFQFYESVFGDIILNYSVLLLIFSIKRWKRNNKRSHISNAELFEKRNDLKHKYDDFYIHFCCWHDFFS